MAFGLFEREVRVEDPEAPEQQPLRLGQHYWVAVAWPGTAPAGMIV